MSRDPVGLGVWFLVRPFVFFRALCVRAAGALVGLAWAFAGRLCEVPWSHELAQWSVLTVS